MTRLRTSLRAFARDESGVMLAEFLILMPILIWGFIALVVYWDVFRTINVTQKAAYSISDLLSRQDVVTEQFASGLHQVLTFLTPGAPASRMRITSFEFKEKVPEADVATWGPDDEYVLLWSRVTGGDARIKEYTAEDLKAMRDTVIPFMDDLQGALIVETWVDYVPRFDIGVLNAGPGLTDQTFTQTIVTFARRRRVCMDGTATCV
jgi:hypothetical protein